MLPFIAKPDTTLAIGQSFDITLAASQATTKINRKDYGVVWNAALETGGVVIGDEITITLEIEMVKSQPK